MSINMKLSPIFSDGCILQRDTWNYVRGQAKPGNRIILKVCDIKIEGEADGEGCFELAIPAFPAQTGITLYLEEFSEREGSVSDALEIREAAFGDVFLLSGQSNMELPVSRTLDVTQDVVKECAYPDIREFAVPMEYDFTAPKKELSGGEWKKAQKEELLSFSAAGFFMARTLYEKYQVPVGLIRTAIGGTPIRAWCSEETVRKLGDYVGELEQCRKEGYLQAVQEKEMQEQAGWYEQAGRFTEKPLGKKGEITVPGMWGEEPLSGFCGSLILEREFFLEEISQDTARLYLGAVVDADKVYINGHLVGETGYRYPPRKYDFPAAYLKQGENHIRVEMFVFRGTGGFIPDKPYYVKCGKEYVKLDGVWEYQIVRAMPVLEDMTFFQYKACGLFNGMLAPLRGHSVRGIAFYQGESDTGSPEKYGKYFEAALGDWRRLFKNPRLPVVYVQLAGFADSKRPCTETDWAILREEQRKALQNPYTAMAVALDLGEYNDLHPQNKLVLGERLAIAMEKLSYGEDIVCGGPLYTGVQKEKGALRILFTQTGSGLCTKGTEKYVHGMELAGLDGVFYRADAEIEENTVVVSCGRVERPVYCRYAWNNNPEEANLYNQEGFPASSFCSEIPVSV